MASLFHVAKWYRYGSICSAQALALAASTMHAATYRFIYGMHVTSE